MFSQRSLSSAKWPHSWKQRSYLSLSMCNNFHVESERARYSTCTPSSKLDATAPRPGTSSSIRVQRTYAHTSKHHSFTKRALPDSSAVNSSDHHAFTLMTRDVTDGADKHPHRATRVAHKGSSLHGRGRRTKTTADVRHTDELFSPTIHNTTSYNDEDKSERTGHASCSRFPQQ